MDHYYVSKRSNNPGRDHEVHRKSCRELPSEQNRIYLGEYYFSSTALTEAKEYYSDADGCAICCPEIHRR